MLRQIFLYLTILTTYCATAQTPNPIYNRTPLTPTHYAQLPLGEIKPTGWLKAQMQSLLDGVTGHLDELYPLVGEDNAWLGGNGDAWERGPYWIDGALPMAYIMGDDALKAKALRWVEAILASQQPSGYFGPGSDSTDHHNVASDWWPRMVALKIMQQYYMATGDKRVIDFMESYFAYQLRTLPDRPLDYWSFWGKERGGDNLLIVLWLYNITGNSELLTLGNLLHQLTVDWTARFTTDDHLFRQNSLHCVNLAQGFKAPVVYYQQSHDAQHLNAPKEALRRIRHTIGFPTGLWAGDELIHFGEPTRGSELCTTIEMMYSLEEMFRITSDNSYLDLLERITYNALPTQITDQADARQYYHQMNQVNITRSWHNFSSPHGDTDLIYGLLSGYPCCTCNMHQAWPKFTQNLWYKSSNGGIAALVYAPSTLNTTIGDVAVCIDEQTHYPFREEVSFVVSFPDNATTKLRFPFELRIPAWSDGYTLTLNGKHIEASKAEGGIITIDRKWHDGDTIRLHFNAYVACTRWWDNAAVIERGPLIYSLKMEEYWHKHICEGADLEACGPYYYEVTSPTPWNVALHHRHLHPESLAEHFIVTMNECSNTPWSVSNAPIQIKGKARILPHWSISRNAVGSFNYMSQQLDTEPEVAEWVDIELIPFGCTTLRITEFPVR